MANIAPHAAAVFPPAGLCQSSRLRPDALDDLRSFGAGTAKRFHDLPANHTVRQYDIMGDDMTTKGGKT
jgi:hypothetical protein